MGADMAVGGSFDTFPKLLLRNAAQFGDHAALRHKHLGIWQTWSWAQVLDIVRAYAVGLHRLGLTQSDTIAIVGSNRPRMYWTMMAAQMLRAIALIVGSIRWQARIGARGTQYGTRTAQCGVALDRPDVEVPGK